MHVTLLRSITLLAVSLTGCASSPPGDQARVAQEISEAAITPLSDLNLVHPEIPPVLRAARKGAYQPPPGAGCPAVMAELDALEEVLSPDIDAPKSKEKPTLLQRGAKAAEEATVGMVRDTTSGVIPFRGWVRKLSGAERSSRDVAAAISAGNLRRAWLKGMAFGSGCMPHMPMPTEAPSQAPEAAPTLLSRDDVPTASPEEASAEPLH